MVVRLVLELLLIFLNKTKTMLQVDQGFELMAFLSCNPLHRRRIVEELHGIALLNVLSFDQLTQEGFDQTFKGCDIITQLRLYGIEDLITQMPFLSLGQAVCKHFLHKCVSTLAHLLQVSLCLLC